MQLLHVETARHQPETLTLLTMTCHFCQFYLPRTPTPIASLQSDHLRFLTCIDPQHLPPTTSAPLPEKYSHLHLATESHHHHLLLNHLKKNSIHHRESCVFTTIAGQNFEYFFMFRLVYQFLAMDNSHALRMSYHSLPWINSVRVMKRQVPTLIIDWFNQGVVIYREATRHTFHDPRIAALDPRNLMRD